MKRGFRSTRLVSGGLALLADEEAPKKEAPAAEVKVEAPKEKKTPPIRELMLEQ